MNPLPWEAVQKSTNSGHIPCANYRRSRFLQRPVDTYNVTLGHVRITIVVMESSITYYKCVYIAVVVHHTARMRRIVMCGLSGCTILFLVTNGTIFGCGGGGLIERQTRFDFLYNYLYETFLILRKIQGGTIINIVGFHVKYPLF